MSLLFGKANHKVFFIIDKNVIWPAYSRSRAWLAPSSEVTAAVANGEERGREDRIPGSDL